MSSYHILNAIWVGVFPMLSVTVLIGIILYFVCCLNRIKILCSKYCKRKRQKRKKQNRRDIEANYSSQTEYEYSKKKNKKSSVICLRDPYEENDQLYLEEKPPLLLNCKEDLKYPMNYDLIKTTQNNQSLLVIQHQKPPPLPSTIPPPAVRSLGNSFPDRSSLTLDLKSNNNATILKPLFHRQSSFEITELQSEPTVLNPESKKPFTSVDFKPVNDRNSEQLDQLIVQELKASPKGIYERLKYLKSKHCSSKQAKHCSELPIITVMDRSPIIVRRPVFLDNTSICIIPLSKSDQKVNISKTSPVKNSTDDLSSKSENSVFRVNLASLDDSVLEDVTKSSSEFSENNKLGDLKDSPSGLKCSKKSVKKIYRKFQKKSPTGSSNSTLYNRKKHQAILQNQIASDFEIEDRIIFNEDDNDSLSSTGVRAESLNIGSSQKGSQLTLTNRSICNHKVIRKRSFENKKTFDENKVTEKKSSSSESNLDNREMLIKTPNKYESFRSSHQEMPSNIYNVSSSDIDPDDNMLKNLLVKNPKGL